MRMSKMFGRTIREVSTEAEIQSYKLMLRSGMIHQLASGMYSYLPMALRSIQKIEKIIREEMNAIDGQELNMPLVHPAELWKESGRFDQLVGKELATFEDRFGRKLVLAMTHEEAITELVRHQINSYRQLPILLYQLKLKFRDEPRPRAGLIRVREFVMKDAYSFHSDLNDLDRFYEQVCKAYDRIFERSGIDVLMVESDPGMIGGAQAHEFMLVSDIGEDHLVLCSNCDYSANLEVAVEQKPKIDNGTPLPIEEVKTPGMTSIDEVASFLGTEKKNSLKAVFYSAGDQLIFGAIRGDLEINEAKLARIVGRPLELAGDKELEKYGIVAGYASPIGVEGVKIIADNSVENSTNLIAGANRPGYHLKNVNFPRDFKADQVVDIALASEGSICNHCGGELQMRRGIEVGNTFKLGTKYSQSMGAKFLDRNGKSNPIVMGCYGIGTGRLLASVIEANHDDEGIIFPTSIAPYQVHLLKIGRGDELTKYADGLYEQLIQEDYEILYDDRSESAGVKFTDADLMGLPIRLVLSSRTLKENSIEVRFRREKEPWLVKLNQFDLKSCFVAS